MSTHLASPQHFVGNWFLKWGSLDDLSSRLSGCNFPSRFGKRGFGGMYCHGQ